MTATLEHLSPEPLTQPQIDALTWSNSQLNTVRACEQKFAYAYGAGLSRSVGTHPLDRGTWFHFVMAIHGFAKGLQDGTLLSVQSEFDVRLPGLPMVKVVPGEYEVVDHPFTTPDDDGSDLETLRTPGKPSECGWKMSVTDRVLGDGTGLDGALVKETNIYPLSVKGAIALLTAEVWEWLPEDVRGDMGEDDGLPLPDEITDLVTRYLYEHRSDIKREKVLAVEHRWQNEYEGKTYTGAIDVIVVDRNDLVIVRDYKTTTKTPESTFRLTDSQLHFYASHVDPWLNAMGIAVDAVEFDYIVTKRPGKVRVTNAGKMYANAGTLDYVSMVQGLKAAVAERDRELDAAHRLIDEAGDPDEQGEAVAKLVKAAEDTLKKKKPIDSSDDYWTKKVADLKDEGSPFFSRVMMPTNDTVTDNLMREAAATVALGEVLLKQEAEPLHNFGHWSCKFCDFTDLCTAKLYGQDPSQIMDQFVIRENAWHINETETQGGGEA